MLFQSDSRRLSFWSPPLLTWDARDPHDNHTTTQRTRGRTQMIATAAYWLIDSPLSAAGSGRSAGRVADPPAEWVE